LAGKSTLNRLELGLEQILNMENRYNRISWDPEKIEDLLIDLFVEHFHETPKEIILDLTLRHSLHGDQESDFSMVTMTTIAISLFIASPAAGH
jgi:hypothetical protein